MTIVKTHKKVIKPLSRTSLAISRPTGRSASALPGSSIALTAPAPSATSSPVLDTRTTRGLSSQSQHIAVITVPPYLVDDYGSLPQCLLDEHPGDVTVKSHQSETVSWYQEPANSGNSTLVSRRDISTVLSLDEIHVNTRR